MSSTKSKFEKVRMLKTKQTKKASRKMRGLEKRGKLKRHVIERVHNIKALKSSDSRQRALNIEDDWVQDRELHYKSSDEDDDDAAAQAEESDDDPLPLDMLDPDLEWETTGIEGLQEVTVKKEVDDNEEEGTDFEKKSRKFRQDLQDDEEEMLPIKLADGTVVRPKRKKEVKVEPDDDAGDEGEAKRLKPDDENEKTATKYDEIPPAQLLIMRREQLDEQKQRIAELCRLVISNPHENVYKLRDLYGICTGDGISPLVREKIQQLAMASLLQVFLDILPGYAFRQLTDTETGGNKLKKETRKLVEYEESVLRYYVKYLQYAEKLTNSNLSATFNLSVFKQQLKEYPESTFAYKMAVLGVRTLCRLILGVPHFNYANNIITALVRLMISSHKPIVEEVCECFARLFHDDFTFKTSLFAVKEIAKLVSNKKAAVPPCVLRTLLRLNIKEIANEDKKSGKNRLIAKKYQIKKERQSKSAKKYEKQLKKLENDLKEVEAEEALDEKKKTATQTMRHVFQIYFSIIKRMPNLHLLDPVLEGLSKFAHLLNIEFFSDIIKSMEELIEQKHVRLIDQVRCINTVFVILSGDGQILNVDPCKFYRALYKLLNALPFEKDSELLMTNIIELSKCLDLALNVRKKHVPLSRVAAFCRRLLCLSLLLDDKEAIVLISLCRSLFIAHPKLQNLVDEEEGEGGGSVGPFAPTLDDPDCSGSLNSDIRPLLKSLVRRRNPVISSFASNIENAVPSGGPHRLNLQWTAVLVFFRAASLDLLSKPWDLLESLELPTDGKGKLQDVAKFAQKTDRSKLTSQNIFASTEKWAEQFV